MLTAAGGDPFKPRSKGDFLASHHLVAGSARRGHYHQRIHRGTSMADAVRNAKGSESSASAGIDCPSLPLEP